VTHLSKSGSPERPAIGNQCVIPAEAGIQVWNVGARTI
jgi:hypothetical protein